MIRSCSRILYAIAIILNIITYSETREPRRIIEGKDAKPGEFPWQVSLRIYDRHICGAAIIGKRHLLTAAHCLCKVKAPFSEMTVVTGSYTLKPGTGNYHRVKNITIHERHVKSTENISVQNDIAVIGLLNEIKVDEFQRPISLPVNDVSNGEMVTVTGFGRIGPIDRATILQKLNIVVLKSDVCFSQGARIRGNQFCGIENFGQCIAKGDSGSPAIRRGPNTEVIVGLVSTAAKCGLRIPAIYTKVYNYLDFIKRAIAST